MTLTKQQQTHLDRFLAFLVANGITATPFVIAQSDFTPLAGFDPDIYFVFTNPGDNWMYRCSWKDHLANNAEQPDSENLRELYGLQPKVGPVRWDIFSGEYVPPQPLGYVIDEPKFDSPIGPEVSGQPGHFVNRWPNPALGKRMTWDGKDYEFVRVNFAGNMFYAEVWHLLS